MHKAVFALVIAAAPLTALEAMPVSEFLAKAEALQKKGPLALFSKDFGLLKTEFSTAGKAIRAEQVAAQKAGRKPASCLPPKAAINSNELLAHFRAIPPAQRGMSVKTGFASLLQKKFPCPA